MSLRTNFCIANHSYKSGRSTTYELFAGCPKSFLAVIIAFSLVCGLTIHGDYLLADSFQVDPSTGTATSETSPKPSSTQETPASREGHRDYLAEAEVRNQLFFHEHAQRSAKLEQSRQAETLTAKLTEVELETAFESLMFGAPDKQTQAQQTLINHGSDALAHFPLITESIPAPELSRLTELRAALELEDRKRRQLPLEVSLDGDFKLEEAVRSIGQQAAVEIDVSREAGNNDSHQWDLQPQPFWQALDQILDRYEASLSSQFRGAHLGVESRPFKASEMVNVASYIEGHRIQPIAVCKLQNFSDPDQNSLRIDLQFSWDPKNVPSMLVVPTMELELQCDNGELLLPISTDTLVHSPEGELRSELSPLFSLPSRQAKKIDRWHGSFLTAYGGAMAGVMFDQLDPTSNSRTRTLQSGILNITLEGIEKNGDLFQIRIGVHVDNDQVIDGLESLVLDSQHTYIVDASGNRIEHVGWTTERFNSNDVGMTFLFELEKGLEGCKFVYLAPGAIHTTTHHFEIIDIPLP